MIKGPIQGTLLFPALQVSFDQKRIRSGEDVAARGLIKIADRQIYQADQQNYANANRDPESDCIPFGKLIKNFVGHNSCCMAW